jgi:hypothetical protein
MTAPILSADQISVVKVLAGFVAFTLAARYVLKQRWLSKASVLLEADLWNHARSRAIALSAMRILTEGLTAVYYLSILEIVLAILLFAYPSMLVVVKAYHGQLLEFVSILITASSVLFGFAFAAESIRTLSLSGQRTTESPSRGQLAKTLGGLCVFLCVLALILNGFSVSGLIGQDYADGTLVLAILAFLGQAVVMSGLVQV